MINLTFLDAFLLGVTGVLSLVWAVLNIVVLVRGWKCYVPSERVVTAINTVWWCLWAISSFMVGFSL